VIAAIVAGALCAVWIWTVLNDDTGIAKHLNRLLSRNSVTKKWMECPWCSGAWFALAATIPLYHPTIFAALVAGFAAAAITGLIGSYIKG
jgi:hypothetical protein